MRITNQEKQTNTYMKYSSNTAQHIRLFYTEQTDAVRIPINFDLCTSAWSKEHYTMITNSQYTSKSLISNQNTGNCYRERERVANKYHYTEDEMGYYLYY